MKLDIVLLKLWWSDMVEILEFRTSCLNLSVILKHFRSVVKLLSDRFTVNGNNWFGHNYDYERALIWVGAIVKSINERARLELSNDGKERTRLELSNVGEQLTQWLFRGPLF